MFLILHALSRKSPPDLERIMSPTPISRGAEIRAASPVAVFGRLVDDPKMFRKIKDGEQIAVERV
jgi:hypothetical protein